MTKKDYLRLKKEIQRHNRLYYQESRPKITDDAYDRLLRQLRAAEEEHPDWAAPDSPTQTVGGAPSEGFRTVAHRVPMMSIDNAYSDEEVLQFDKRVEKGLGHGASYVVELKIDGVSISLHYRAAALEQGITRGDGQSGDDVTANIRAISAIPQRLSKGILPEEIDIRGEIFMNHKTFVALNEEREEEGEPVFANPRNSASGSLKLLEPELVAKRRLQFVAHGVGHQSEERFASQEELLTAYRKAGVPTHLHFYACKDIREALERCHEWEKKRDEVPFDVDGMVIKVNRFEDQKKLGVTSKSPRYAVAYKFPAKRAETRLEKIDVQVGRTGVLTPVAWLKPVSLAGSVVARATLHNADEIERLGLKIGDSVLIEKSGEIIPQIVSVVANKRTGKEQRFKMPSRCPACDSAVKREPGEVAVRCLNANCPAQIKAKILHFSSRKAMDIEGMGDAVVAQLVDSGKIKKLSDIYRLRADDLESLERMGPKSASNLISAIDKSKSQDLSRLIFGLGIRHVGSRSALTLALRFKEMDALIAAREEDLRSLKDVGPVVAGSVVLFFENPRNTAMIRDLERAGLNLKSRAGGRGHPFFEGKTFVVTGTLKNFSREEISEKIESLGGRVSSSVSAKTHYVIAGSEPGSKLETAKKLGVAVLNENQIQKEIPS